MDGGDPVGSRGGAVRKENISAGNSFLSVWRHKQTEAQEERKEAKKRKEDRKMCKHVRGKVGVPVTGATRGVVLAASLGFFLLLLKIFHKPRRRR